MSSPLAALRFLWRALPLVVLLAIAVPPAASAEPPPPRVKLTEKPSGFWTSTRPAKGGAYRYRMLGIGVALAAITGLITYRVIRGNKGPRPRPGSPAAPQQS